MAQSNKAPRAVARKSYAEKLRDPRWQKMRLLIMERDGFKCRIRGCQAEDKTLNVHHRFYRKGADPWEYDMKDLVTLCESCHALQESRKKLIDEAIAGPSRMQDFIMRIIQLYRGEGPFSHPAFHYILDRLNDFSGEFECAVTADQGTREEAECNINNINQEFVAICAGLASLAAAASEAVGNAIYQGDEV